MRTFFVNIGNTNITLGYFSGGKFIILKTLPSKKASISKLFLKGADFEKLVLASVVPDLTVLLKKKYKGKIFEIKNKDVPLKNLYINRKETGVDRLLVSLGAYSKYQKPCIVVDFGTATTLNLVSKKGEFLGGVIAPGTAMFSSYLFEKTSKLPSLKLLPVTKIVGKSTKECIRAGIFFGNIGMVSGLIKMAKNETGVSLCISTGGAGRLISKYISGISSYDPYLIFYGMKEICDY